MRLQNYLITIVSLSLVGTIVMWENQQKVNPGTLHPSHAGIAELQGSKNCESCHGNDAQSLDAACIVCHEFIGEDRKSQQRFHGQSEKARTTSCGACHTEHGGAHIALTSDRSFLLAGVKERTKYDHGHIKGYQLKGKHATLACDKCHKKEQQARLAKGESRYQGLEQKCASCHEDVHKGRFGVDSNLRRPVFFCDFARRDLTKILAERADLVPLDLQARGVGVSAARP